jgi:pyruvate-formate lyase-activating enzyme
LGVNVNPDKVCNFDCVYCEVDRTRTPKRKDVDLDRMEYEMRALLDLAISGGLYGAHPLLSAEEGQSRLNDIAFSGDGEPTASPAFAPAAARIADLKRSHRLDGVKLVLITNASRLQSRGVVDGIDGLMECGGEIWAKLDAGDEAQYRALNRSDVPLADIVGNLAFAGRRWPIKIQTLFLEWQGRGPSEGELAAYLDRLKHLLDAGIKLQGLQLYTVARPTPEPGARPLRAALLDEIAGRVAEAMPNVSVEVFYGPVA